MGKVGARDAPLIPRGSFRAGGDCLPKRHMPVSVVFPQVDCFPPPDLREWLPEGSLALFISDVVYTLDLSDIYRVYEDDDRGHPAMMVKLLIYGCSTGKSSSRKIERATWDEVAFRVLSVNQNPDHSSIAAFPQRHPGELRKLLMQVLRLCQKAGLVKLGHVALDGTKVKANASKHKAMSYGRMVETEKQLEREIEELLKLAERTDAAEDAKFGKGQSGDDLPKELQRRESRVAKIREAKAQLEDDKEQLVPMLKEAATNVGQAPLVASADAGYFSSKAVEDKGLAGVDLYGRETNKSTFHLQPATRRRRMGP